MGVQKSFLSRVTQLLTCALFVTLAYVPRAAAQLSAIDPTTIRLTCTSPTVCTGGTITEVTSAGLPTFTIGVPSGNNGLNLTTGSLWLVVLVPGSSSLTFTANGIAAQNMGSGAYTSGKLTDFLGVIATFTSEPDFNAFASASGQVSTTPSAFTVYLVNLGAYSGNTVQNVTLAGLTSFPAGTIFYGMITRCDPSVSNCSTIKGQNLVNTSPLSESITTSSGGKITPVPEPASMLLFGSGMVMFGGLFRRQRRLKRS